jgi:hypothetical protein
METLKDCHFVPSHRCRTRLRFIAVNDILRLTHWACLLLIFCIAASCTGADDRQFLDDQADLLNQESRQRIIAYHRALLKDFDIHCKLVTLARPSQDINGAAIELFDNLGASTGQARGLLFLVDPLGEQVRIEVGYDLEHIFPDAFVGHIERRQMVPFFQRGLVGSGIEATEELFITRIQRSSAGQPFDAAVELGAIGHYSGGGGARQQVVIGSEGLANQPAATDPDNYQPGASPEQSLAVYRQVLLDKVKDPNLPLYTPQTRKFLSAWVVTDAQQDNALRSLQEATIDQVLASGNRAVIRFPLLHRTHPPYLLKNNGQGWEIDFATMNQVIRMNHRNMWHFITREHPYMFGFTDWKFDNNGFPVAEP